jgi:hypothetical protein
MKIAIIGTGLIDNVRIAFRIDAAPAFDIELQIWKKLIVNCYLKTM